MVSIRRASVDDLLGMQECNLTNLPENYTMKYYYYHIISWPHLSHVAVNESGRIIGYCLGKLDDDEDGEKEGNLHGHITSISVLRSYRRMGIASMLLRATHEAMLECYQAKFCALHVRERNRAALALYENTLHYKLHLVEEGYYGDGENALELRLPLSKKENLTFPDEFDDFPVQQKETEEQSHELYEKLKEKKNKHKAATEHTEEHQNAAATEAGKPKKKRNHKKKK